MSDRYAVLAIGPCWACKQPFAFDPRTVTSVWVDPVTQLPPELGGDRARADRQPICCGCVALVNEQRAKRGAEPIPLGSIGSPTEAEVAKAKWSCDPHPFWGWQ
jgi:hypothetical protein